MTTLAEIMSPSPQVLEPEASLHHAEPNTGMLGS